MRQTYLFVAVFIALFAIIVSMGLVSAQINITLPANDTVVSNYTSTMLANHTYIFNVTFTNGTGTGAASSDFTATPQTNATFFYNLSGVWTPIANASKCYYTATLGSCMVNFSVASLTEGVYTINATVWNGTNSNKANSSSANVIWNFTLNEIPRVTGPNITRVSQGDTFSHGANVSGIVLINITINETFDIDAVFNITNTSNTAYKNWSYNLSREGTTYQYFNGTINTAWFADGMYNITFYVTDALRELNDTEMIRNIYIDNTAPSSVVITKLDSTKTALNGTITITDAGVGSLSSPACTVTRNIGGAQITVDSTPGVATQIFNDVGLDCAHTYKYTATCTDNSANGKTSEEVSISTDACSSSSSSGTSGTTSTAASWTFTVTQNDAELATKGEVAQSLGSKHRVKLMVNSQTHYIGVTEVTATTAKIQVSSTPQEATMAIGDSRMFDVDGDKVYDVKVTLSAINNGKADVKIVSIKEAVTAESEAAQTAANADAAKPITPETTKTIGSKVWIWVVVIIIVIAVVVWFVMKKGKIGKRR